MERKLILVSVRLDDTGWGAKTMPMTVQEKDKTFVGEGKRIRKDEIMRPSNGIMYNRNLPYRMQTYCFEGDEKKAVLLLSEEIKNKFLSEHARVNKVYELIKDTLTSPNLNK